MRTAAGVLIVLTLSGCASAPPAPAAAAVMIDRDSAAVKGCERLGPVRASSLLTGVLVSQGYDATISDLRNKTAELGGNHVLVFDFTSNHSSNNASGEAYRCPT